MAGLLMSWLRDHPFFHRRPYVKEFIKFSVVGAMNTALDLAIYTVLVFVGQVYFLAANVIAFLLASINSYVLNRRWTFRSRDPQWQRQMQKFMLVSVISFGLNEGLLYVAGVHLGAGKFLAKIMATIITLFWNFLVNRFWTFRQR